MMGELLNTILLMQKYIIALIIITTAFLWYSIKSKDKILLSTNIFLVSLVFTTSFPFIIEAISFIPRSIGLILKVTLIFLASGALFVSSFLTYKSRHEERIGVLKDILNKKQDDPLKLEFVREVIQPELKLLNKQKYLIEKEKKAVEKNIEFYKQKSEEISLGKIDLKNEWKNIKKENSLLTKEQDKLDELKDKLELESKKIEKLRLKTEKESGEIKEKKKGFLNYEDELNKEKAKLKLDFSDLEKEKKELSRFKQKLDEENENILLKQREILELNKKLKSAESENLNLRKKISTLQAVIKKNNFQEEQ